MISPMPNKLAHFAIEAESVDRAKDFYEAVFSWTFEPWGPPGFYLIHDAGVHGALQSRNGPLGDGRKGFPCTFAVEDIGKTIKLIEKAGGKIQGQRQNIPTVGELIEFMDTEGNEAIIMQYDPEQLKSLNL